MGSLWAGPRPSCTAFFLPRSPGLPCTSTESGTTLRDSRPIVFGANFAPSVRPHPQGPERRCCRFLIRPLSGDFTSAHGAAPLLKSEETGHAETLEALLGRLATTSYPAFAPV